MKSEEDKLQAECFQWAWNEFPQSRRCLFAVPNGGKRDIREAVKFKATGVVKGTLDLFLIWRGTTFVFELKTEKGILSEDQKKSISALEGQDARCYVLRTVEDFKEIYLTIMSNTDYRDIDGDGYSALNHWKELWGSFKYEADIFEYISGLKDGTIVNVDDITTPKTKQKFIRVVKSFIRMRFDRDSNFNINFTEDYDKFQKLDLKQDEE